jgi:trk system potassium uptake protein TrkH
MPSHRTLAHFSPGKIILLSVVIAIALGAAALSLPYARTQPISLIDLVFTATSAACVTGHFTVPLDYFTRFGHTIIMILMQIGGIGLITLTIFLLSLFVNFDFAHQVMAGQLMELETWKNTRRMLIFIILSTCTIELLGALMILPIVLQHYPFGQAVYLSFFHAISSFCNAGITLFPPELRLYQTNGIVMSVTALLMFLGGLGFITWKEIMYWIRSLNQKKRYTFSLHSKIVLASSCAIIALTAGLIWLVEGANLVASIGFLPTITHVLFDAISFRSGGFTIIPLSLFSIPILFFITQIMFIGTSPGSTGSGVKVTTIAILLATIRAAISDRAEVEIKGRRIPRDLLFRSIAVIALGVSWILTIFFLLLLSEPAADFFTLLFETVSSFANVGLTLGITATLNTLSKILLIMTMIIGRVGSFTLILAIRHLALRHLPETAEFSYPEERIMIN